MNRQPSIDSEISQIFRDLAEAIREHPQGQGPASAWRKAREAVFGIINDRERLARKDEVELAYWAVDEVNLRKEGLYYPQEYFEKRTKQLSSPPQEEK